MSSVLLSFIVGSMMITALCAVGALVFVRVFKIHSPLGRFLVFLAPLLAAFVDRVRLFPERTAEVVAFCFLIAVLLLSRDVYTYVAFRRRIRRQTEPAADLQPVVDELARSIGMRPPRVLVSSNPAVCPFAAGIRNPVLVVPRAMISVLSEDEVRLLLAHEMAHVRRKDLVWKWLLIFLRYLSFMNPMAELPYRWLNVEMERGCDKLAISIIGKPGTMARTLLKVEEFIARMSRASRNCLPVVVSGAGSYLPLRIRLMASLQGKTNVWLTLAKVGVIFYIFNLICLISVNTWLIFFP